MKKLLKSEIWDVMNSVRDPLVLLRLHCTLKKSQQMRLKKKKKDNAKCEFKPQLSACLDLTYWAFAFCTSRFFFFFFFSVTVVDFSPVYSAHQWLI